MKKQERLMRVVARGEYSGHAHVIVGGEITEDGYVISSEIKKAVIKHIKEEDWLKGGRQVWTGEHHDLVLKPGRYKIVHQQEISPTYYQVRRVID